MLKELLAKQKRQINAFFHQFDPTETDALVQEILGSDSTLFFTGVGKSGLIARKIAATMQSTGTKAFFLCPTDALHGDLGAIGEKDMVLILSKSGETEELLQLLAFIRVKGGRTIAVTSNRKSRLALSTDLDIYLPCEEELCPFNLAPTTSTSIQLLFGDALAIALMEGRGFSREQYAKNHPRGRIGRHLSVRVSDLMLDQKRTPTCLAQESLERVIADFSDKRCGCMIVIDEHRRLKGIFTDGDLRRALQAKGERVLKEQIGDLMTPCPKAVKLEDFAADALKLMEEDQLRPVAVLPVLGAQDEVVGIIKMHDLIQAGL